MGKGIEVFVVIGEGMVSIIDMFGWNFEGWCWGKGLSECFCYCNC